MKKVLGFIVVLLLLAAGGAWFVLNNLDAIVKTAIEKVGTAQLGEDVTVQSVSFKLKEGSGEITGLHIQNPEGFTDPNLFELGTVRLAIDPASIKESDPLIIDEVTVESPELFVEMLSLKENNLDRFAAGIKSSDSESKSKDDAAPQNDDSAESPKMIIRKLRIAEVSVQARAPGLDPADASYTLPTLEMYDLGAPHGKDAAAIATEITLHISKKAMKELSGFDLDQAKQDLKDKAMKEAGSFLNKLKKDDSSE